MKTKVSAYTYDFKVVENLHQSSRVFLSWKVDIDYGLGCSCRATPCSYTAKNAKEANDFLKEHFNKTLEDLI